MTACSPFLFTGSGRISDIFKVSVPSPEMKEKMCLFLNCCSAWKTVFQLCWNGGLDWNKPFACCDQLEEHRNGVLPTTCTKWSLAFHIFASGSQLLKHMYNFFLNVWWFRCLGSHFACFLENFHKKESACKTTKIYFSASCGKRLCMAV